MQFKTPVFQDIKTKNGSILRIADISLTDSQSPLFRYRITVRNNEQFHDTLKFLHENRDILANKIDEYGRTNAITLNLSSLDSDTLDTMFADSFTRSVQEIVANSINWFSKEIKEEQLLGGMFQKSLIKSSDDVITKKEEFDGLFFDSPNEQSFQITCTLADDLGEIPTVADDMKKTKTIFFETDTNTDDSFWVLTFSFQSLRFTSGKCTSCFVLEDICPEVVVTSEETNTVLFDDIADSGSSVIETIIDNNDNKILNGVPNSQEQNNHNTEHQEYFNHSDEQNYNEDAEIGALDIVPLDVDQLEELMKSPSTKTRETNSESSTRNSNNQIDMIENDTDFSMFYDEDSDDERILVNFNEANGEERKKNQVLRARNKIEKLKDFYDIAVQNLIEKKSKLRHFIEDMKRFPDEKESMKQMNSNLNELYKEIEMIL